MSGLLGRPSEAHFMVENNYLLKIHEKHCPLTWVVHSANRKIRDTFDSMFPLVIEKSNEISCEDVSVLSLTHSSVVNIIIIIIITITV